MIKYISIADIISLINAIFGFLSIIFLLLNEIHYSFTFILLALMADGLDGIVARKTRESEIGTYIEAIADIISLALAPTIFIYYNYLSIVTNYIESHILLILSITTLLSLSIIRLSSFHLVKEKKYFTGYPVSASTILLIVLTYLHINILIIIPLIFIISIFLILNIKFPKPSMKISILTALIIFLTIILGKSYNNIVPMILLFLIIIYSLFGPIFILMKIK
jgi:CDP-diacylglycerol--serine O-phosphatidyltransferase